MTAYEKLTEHLEIDVKVSGMEPVKVPHCGAKFVPDRLTLTYRNQAPQSVTVFGYSRVEGYGHCKGWYEHQELEKAPEWVRVALREFAPEPAQS